MRKLSRTRIRLHILGLLIGLTLAVYAFFGWKDTGFEHEGAYSTNRTGDSRFFLFLLGLTATGYFWFSPGFSRWLFPSSDDKPDDDEA